MPTTTELVQNAQTQATFAANAIAQLGVAVAPLGLSVTPLQTDLATLNTSIVTAATADQGDQQI